MKFIKNLEYREIQSYNFITPSGFTLIELLISVTISAVLMTGILIFVSSSLGLQNTTRETLMTRNTNASFEQKFTRIITEINRIYASGATFGGKYQTGMIVGTDSYESPIAYIGTMTATGYCDNYSGTTSETGTVQKLVIRHFVVASMQNATPYTISMTGSSVYSGTTRIIGTWVPGGTLGISWTGTELSSPSAITTSGWYVYVADTMNNRILSYSGWAGTITKILDTRDGISHPTSLYLTGNELYITNAGNGKIIKYLDGDGGDGTKLSVSFKVANNFSANKLVLTFSGITTIDSPTTYGSFTLSNILTGVLDTVGTGLNLTYSGVNLTSFLSGAANIYGIAISDISPPPTLPGHYPVRIDFYSGATLSYSDIFPYFTHGDNSLLTDTGNTLLTYSGWFEYPNSLTGPLPTWSGSIDWTNILNLDPPWDENTSMLPVRDFSYSKTGNIVTIKYNEYIRYDCLKGRHQLREKIIKIFMH